MERAAVRLASRVGELLYESGVELVLFRKHLLDQTVSEILSFHSYHNEVIGSEMNVDVFLTAEIADSLIKIDLAPSKVDLGRLALEWISEKSTFKTLDNFLKSKLQGFTKAGAPSTFTPKDVILFGFGRIGRLAARELIKQAGKGQQLRLRAVVTRDKDPEDIRKRAALLSNDSVHGAFKGSVTVDVENQVLHLNGQSVRFISAKSPEEIDYTQYGIQDALVIDNTGVFSSREALSRHMQAKGVAKVLLTAPGKDIPNIVYGVNQGQVDFKTETIFSAASCTTNAIVPILKVIIDNFKIEKGHIETIHSYTNDQNLLDNFHRKARRGRSAAINMVITETGAAKAVTEVIPALKNLLTANAVRVPTPNASLAILNLTLDRETSVEEINDIVCKKSLQGDLVNQIFYSIDPEMVSSDVVGNDCCSVFDSHATLTSNDKRNVVLYAWYDNEHGYTKQVIRLAKHICGVRRQLYY